jgi:hypothetical protein
VKHVKQPTQSSLFMRLSACFTSTASSEADVKHLKQSTTTDNPLKEPMSDPAKYGYENKLPDIPARKQRLKLINKFAAACEREISTPRENETPSQRKHRLLTDVSTRITMFIDAGLYERGERGKWIRLYWETESKVHEAAHEMAERCIAEGRQ